MSHSKYSPLDADNQVAVDKIVEYATARGVREAKAGYVAKGRGGYWELTGVGDDRKGLPLVWRVADELRLHGGCGNSNQCQICHPARAAFPNKPWEPEYTTLPIKANTQDTQAKQEKLLEELVGALIVLPEIIRSLSDAPVEEVEPYGNRIVLATLLLQQIESRVHANIADIDDSDDSDESDDTELWETDSEETDEDKDAAIAALVLNT